MITEVKEKRPVPTIWLIDIDRNLAIREVPITDVIICGEMDCPVLEENNELRPVWLVNEDDYIKELTNQ